MSIASVTLTSDPAHSTIFAAAVPAWLKAAAPSLRQAYYASSRLSLASQRKTEAILAQLQPPADFARPLLRAALLREFPGIEVDVDHHELVRVSLDSEVRLDGGVQTGQLQRRQQTLLEAAMVNFQAHETQTLEAAPGYAVILPAGAHRFEVDEHGVRQYVYARSSVVDIRPERFAASCRTLDLGGQYETHLKAVLNPMDTHGRQPGAHNDTARSILYNLRDALEVQAHVARMQGHITQDSYDLLLQLTGPHPEKARWRHSDVRFCHISLLGTLHRRDTRLVGAVIIQRKNSEQCLAYLPGEPVHALKEFPSLKAFADALREKLRDRAYQSYFKQLVANHEQVAFFERLNGLLVPEPAWLNLFEPKPARVADPQANLDIKAFAADTSLLRLLYEHFLLKASSNARWAVVPTYVKSAQEHRQRLAYYASIGMSALNVAAFVVPGIAEVMAAVGAVQLVSDVCIGIDEWQHHQVDAALDHFISVAENLALVAGTLAVQGALARSVFIEGLVPVGEGQQARLWNPDLTPYRRTLDAAAADTRANALGQYEVDGQHYVRIEEGWYQQVQDPVSGTWKLVHPVEEGRWHPEMTHNRSGAWRHVHELPQHWDDATVMRRLGPASHDLDDLALTQACRLSGVEVGQIRACLVHDVPTPATLEDTLMRYQVDVQTDRLIDAIHHNQPLARADTYPAPLLVRLPQWPAEIGVQLDGEPATLYEALPGQSTRRVRVTQDELTAGRLVPRVIEQLDAPSLQRLFGDSVEHSAQARAEVLGQRLADQARLDRDTIFNSLNTAREPLPTPASERLLQAYPELPSRLAQEIIEQAPDSERQRLLGSGQVPGELAEQARSGLREARLNHALEGLYRPTLMNADSTRLAVKGMGALPGWSGKVRLEVRQDHLRGELLVSVGDAADAERKFIVVREGGYQALDDRGQELGGTEQLFAAILHALPDSERQALALQVTDSAALRQQVADLACADRDRASRVLGQTVEQAWMRPYSPRLQSVAYQGSGRELSDPLTRLRRLYCGLSALDRAELEFSWRAAGHDLAVLAPRLEKEYRVLSRTLEEWVAQPATLIDEQGQSVAVDSQSRQQAADQIRASWRREVQRPSPSNSVGRLALDLTGLQVGELPVLTASFSHVELVLMPSMSPGQGIDHSALGFFLGRFDRAAEVVLSGNALEQAPTLVSDRLTYLDLRNNRLDEASGGLRDLGAAPRLRQLRLDYNRLAFERSTLDALRACPHLEILTAQQNRIHLDAAGWSRLALMPRLIRLDLAENRIAFTQATAQSLLGLDGLRELNLSGNPLVIMPDVSALTRLEYLNLRGAQISEWSDGLTQLLRDPGARLFQLDLGYNQLVEVPSLANSEFVENYRAFREGPSGEPYSFSIEGNPLSAAARERLNAAGLTRAPGNPANDPAPEPTTFDGALERDAQELAAQPEAVWLEGCPEPLRSKIEALGEEPGASTLFRTLQRSVESSLYKDHKPAACARVWDILRTVVEPSEEVFSLGVPRLRDQLFQAIERSERTCGDAVAMLLQRCETLVFMWKSAARAATGGEALMQALLVDARKVYLQVWIDTEANTLYLKRWLRLQAIRARAADPQVVVPPLYPGDALADNLLNIGIDQVEIVMHVRAQLARTLPLPEQFGEPLYAAHVDANLIQRVGQNAQAQILAAGQEGFLDWLVEQPSWEAYLKLSYTLEINDLSVQRLAWREAATGYLVGLSEKVPVTQIAAPPAGMLEELTKYLPTVTWQVDGKPQSVELTDEQWDSVWEWLNGRDLKEEKAILRAFTSKVLPDTMELDSDG